MRVEVTVKTAEERNTMITESVKTLLGADLTRQVEEALQGKGKDGKDVDLVVGNDGSFVPADKFDGEKRGKSSAEAALKKAAEALKAIGGSGDPTKLAEDVEIAKGTIETLQNDHKAELKKIHTDTAIRMALAGKVHDPSDVIGLLADKVEVNEDGTLKSGIDDLLAPIKESKPYLFVEAKAADVGGVEPAAGGQKTEPVSVPNGPVIF